GGRRLRRGGRRLRRRGRRLRRGGRRLRRRGGRLGRRGGRLRRGGGPLRRRPRGGRRRGRRAPARVVAARAGAAGSAALRGAGLRTRVRVAGALADHHAVPGLTAVGAEELAVVLVFVLVEHAAPNSVVVIAMPVLVHAGRRVHGDGLGSGVDAEELILSARARTEARATVSRGVRIERVDALA